MINKKEYYLKNKERILKQMKKYYQEKRETILECRRNNKEYIAEYDKEYYKKNKEKVSAVHKKWLEQNPEYYKERSKTEKEKNRKKLWNKEHPEYLREYRKKNREKILGYLKEYYQENKRLFLENRREYRKTEEGKASHQRGGFKIRAGEREIINTLTAKEWLDILEKNNYKCAYCGIEFNEDTLPERDHIIPISKGGNNIKENIAPACKSCNLKKSNKLDKLLA